MGLEEKVIRDVFTSNVYLGKTHVFLVIFISDSVVFSKKYGFNCLCKGFPFAFLS